VLGNQEAKKELAKKRKTMYRKSIGSPLHHLFNWTLYKETYQQWSADNAGRLAAALAYHSAMAAAPLIIGVLAIVGLVYDTKRAQLQLVAQANHFIGSQGAETINTILANADQPQLAKWAGILSLILLLWSASNIFVQLQDSLNTVWGVQLRPDLPLRRKIEHRALPLLVVLVIGALLLVAVIASAALTAVAAFFTNLLPGGEFFWQFVNFLISLAVITILFALIFKFLPDVKIRWPDLWPGSLLTAILFVFGQFLLGWYLGRQSSASVYGAAGSLIVLLLWLYYSAQIFLFGAEFTQVYATRYGHGVLPAKDAVAREISVPDKPAAQAATAGVMEESEAQEPQGQALLPISTEARR
jgi:membrane protein